MKAFADKVALITRTTAGIGRATAVAFAREGARVVLAGRRAPGGAATVRLVRDVGGAGLFIKTAVTVEAVVAALIQQTLKTYGRLDCAFKNAGTIALSPLVDATMTASRQVMETNVQGVFLGLKYGSAAMLAAGGGASVNATTNTDRQTPRWSTDDQYRPLLLLRMRRYIP